FIRKGYSQGENFISVSNKTREDLHRFLGYVPPVSEVVYNGLNRAFEAREPAAARAAMEDKTGLHLRDGYILHVGGNQWYKNRVGVIEIYDEWRKGANKNLPLLLIGATPSLSLKNRYEKSPFKKDIHFLTSIGDDMLLNAYSGASVFLFPSLAEGFGWPIAEAMACGCPVITTNEPPMTEVGGEAAYYIPRRNTSDLNWAGNACEIVDKVFGLSLSERDSLIEKGLVNVCRFDQKNALDQIEAIYKKVLLNYAKS
ncbi:MAG: glycosyltransferase, partial [Cytophagaceae bacterium]